MARATAPLDESVRNALANVRLDSGDDPTDLFSNDLRVDYDATSTAEF